MLKENNFMEEKWQKKFFVFCIFIPNWIFLEGFLVPHMLYDLRILAPSEVFGGVKKITVPA